MVRDAGSIHWFIFKDQKTQSNTLNELVTGTNLYGISTYTTSESTHTFLCSFCNAKIVASLTAAVTIALGIGMLLLQNRMKPSCWAHCVIDSELLQFYANQCLGVVQVSIAVDMLCLQSLQPFASCNEREFWNFWNVDSVVQ